MLNDVIVIMYVLSMPGPISLSELKTVVLDEADAMVDRYFYNDTKTLFSKLKVSLQDCQGLCVLALISAYCASIHVRTCTCACTHTHTHTHTHTRARTHAHTHARMHTVLQDAFSKLFFFYLFLISI